MAKIDLSCGLTCLVDDEDLPKVEFLTWYFSTGYVQAMLPEPDRRSVRIHRVIMDAADGVSIDHINGDTLDNRRVNLRFCTPGENKMNSRKQKNATSRFKGVSLSPGGRWQVYCGNESTKRYRGTYDDEIEAARVYDRFAIELYGEFARINFPSGDE